MIRFSSLRWLTCLLLVVMIHSSAGVVIAQYDTGKLKRDSLVELLSPRLDPNSHSLPVSPQPSFPVNHQARRLPVGEQPLFINTGLQNRASAPVPQLPPVAEPYQITQQPVTGNVETLPAPAPAYGHQISPDTIEPPECIGCSVEPWNWQILPDGLLYKAYVAGTREGRFSTAWLYDSDGRWVWDSTLGARIGVVRFGTTDANNPEGWQLDMEGASFTRLDMDIENDLDGADFIFAVPLSYSQGPWDFQFGYYHISSHVGDEFLENNPGFVRNNYLRNAIIFGVTYHINQDWSVYGEAGWSYETSGNAEPWEFQFGVDYAPAIANGLRGTPYFGINGYMREELNFGGGVNVMTGWQWRGRESDRTFRIGFQYYNGASLQNSFTFEHEELTGLGLWYDF